jgi:Nucleotide-sugar transporter
MYKIFHLFAHLIRNHSLLPVVAKRKRKRLSSLVVLNNRLEMYNPNFRVTVFAAVVFLASGVGQPLVMQVCKSSGLADASAQLYMLAYYVGPASLVFTLQWDDEDSTTKTLFGLIRKKSAMKAAMIALIDIAAQSLNYTGAGLAGATIFAVIYSSVTVWTAVFSVILLHRSLTIWQWTAIFIVFGGLAFTASDSINLGPDVVRGTMLIFLGSCLHGGTYVLSEAIMIGSDQLSPRQNSAIQGLVASSGFLLWQIFYTLPRWEQLIEDPMKTANTTYSNATLIMLAFSLLNLAHSYSFYHTLKYFPGGSASAGVMKGLQAVLVFVAAHFVFCHQSYGKEMCFSRAKFASLILVVSGVILFGFTSNNFRAERKADLHRQPDADSLVAHAATADEGYGAC